MPNLLFAPETLNIAETTRMLEIARAVQGDFTPVFSGYDGNFAPLVEKASFPYHKLQPVLTLQRVEELWKADRMERGGKFFTEAELSERVANELKLFEQVKPAAIVMGFTLSVYISARAAGIPLVVVAPLPFTRPFFEAGLGAWPDALNVAPLRWLPQRWLDGLVNWFGLHTRIWTRPINQVARRYGVPPFKRLVDLFEGDYTLVTDIPELTGLHTLPPTWRYVGPIFARLEGEVPPEVQRLPRNRPWIYFAMGSSGNREIVLHVLELLGQMPYQIIAPIKAHLVEASVSVPDNVCVLDWVPAHKVNPLADVAVIHGGQGTVQTAVASGTPFVGIGMQPEQEANIDLIARQGCAIRLRKYDVTTANLCDAIEQLLHDPQARQRARDLQTLSQQWDGPANVARFLRAKFLAVPQIQEVS